MPEIDHPPREPSVFMTQLLQIGVALAVSFAAIYISQQLEYPISGAIIGVWSFMAAYAVTWLLFKTIDIRRYGWNALPPKAVMWSVAWKVALVVIGYIAAIIIFAYVGITFFS